MEPSRNICTLDKTETHVIYKATCGCMDDSHGQTIFIEKEHNLITVTIYSDYVAFDGGEHAGWKHRVKQRITGAWKLLVTGRAAMESEFVFTTAEAIRAYSNAVISAVDHLEEQ